MAYSAPGSDRLLNLKYERDDTKDFITLRFKLPDRFFHVEFYDPLATETPQRDYTYVWPANLATDRLAVIIQEPAGTLDLSATPSLEATATGQHGLRYRSAQLGAFEAGKQLPIKIAYTKTNSRTTTEIFRPQVDGSLPAISSPTATSTGEATSVWVLMLSVALPLGIAAGAVFFLWRRRRATACAALPIGGRYCSKCGAQTASGDRFCWKCGAALK